MPAADLLELGRRGRIAELAQQAEQARAAAGWDGAAALELAAAWLLAGDRRQADLAVLEADQLAPYLALGPDPWGLWPAPEPPAPADPALLALAERLRSWRQPDSQALWRQLLPQLQADWRAVLEPPLLDVLLILGRASALPGAPPLQPPLGDALVGLVSDAEIAAEPAASNRFWQLLATIRPHWALARIRAADLALARGELEASGRWLVDPPAEALSNPWFFDVAARQAVAAGDVAAALDAWAEAIRIAQADPSSAPAEIFEQRCREARRGPGVLQVRSLTNRGEQAAALALLERLLVDDPQWQPLRSLREQIGQAGQIGQSQQAPSPAPAPAPAPSAQPTATGFEALLERATARLQGLGGSLPQPVADTASSADLAAELSSLERRLSDYEARFALA